MKARGGGSGGGLVWIRNSSDHHGCIGSLPPAYRYRSFFVKFMENKLQKSPLSFIKVVTSNNTLCPPAPPGIKVGNGTTSEKVDRVTSNPYFPVSGDIWGQP